MSKIVTYQGPANRYYVTDENKVRIYFPRGERVEVSDELAAQIGTRGGRFTVEDPLTGDETGSTDPDQGEQSAGDQEPTKTRNSSRRSGSGSSEEKK